MSHTLRITAELKNKEAILRAAQELGVSVNENFHDFLYQRDRKIKGVALHFEKVYRDWKYPVVLETNAAGEFTGDIAIDNYNGAWGDIQRLKDFQKQYALEDVKMKFEAQKIPYTVKKVGNSYELEAYA